MAKGKRNTKQSKSLLMPAKVSAGRKAVRVDIPGTRTVRAVICELGLEDWLQPGDLKGKLDWPPDVFAVAALILRDSGAYAQAVRSTTPLPEYRTSAEWQGHVRGVAFEWGADPQNVPMRVVELWEGVVSHAATSLAEVANNDRLWHCLLELMAISDEAAAGTGVAGRLFDRISGVAPVSDEQINRITEPESVKVGSTLKFKGTTNLAKQAEGFDRKSNRTIHDASTLCKRICPSRLIVLPKMRTPQRGVTIRSFSHHLCLVTGGEVVPSWVVAQPAPSPGKQELRSDPAARRRQCRTFNFLVLPLPERVLPAQFKAIDLTPSHQARVQRMPEGQDMFCFEHASEDYNLRDKVQQLVNQVGKVTGQIDAVVLPEMAVEEASFFNAFGGFPGDRQSTPGNNHSPSTSQPLPEGVRWLVAGVYRKPTGVELGRNYAVVRRQRASDGGEAPRADDYEQDKHHRWALDDSQIRTYGLSASLHPDTVWWEAIKLPNRNLYFYPLDENVVFTVLICEDLARPDPVGDIVRAVGPNLVIALLADGPQLLDRWSSRYATVLSDDPGSSVLTLTSVGMASLSRPGESTDAVNARTIGLWREPGCRVRPLSLPAGACGLVLSISESWRREWTADGREDDSQAGYLRLGGVTAVDWNGKRCSGAGACPIMGT